MAILIVVTEKLTEQLRTGTREHTEIAFQQRQQQILGNCRQLKNDVNSYNDNYNGGLSLQLVFDFTMIVEEELARMALAADYPWFVDFSDNASSVNFLGTITAPALRFLRVGPFQNEDQAIIAHLSSRAPDLSIIAVQ